MTVTQERDDLQTQVDKLKEQIRTGYAPTDGPPPEPTMAVTEVRNDLREKAHNLHENVQAMEHFDERGIDVTDPQYTDDMHNVDVHPDPEKARQVLADNEKYRDQAVYDQVVQTNKDFPHAAALAVARGDGIDPGDYEKMHKLEVAAADEQSDADDKAARAGA